VAPWKFPSFSENTSDEHIEDRMAREAAAFMEQHQHEPFFLNYWMFSVHAPFDAKQALVDKHRSRVNLQDSQRSPTYAAMIESMDDALGALLDTLDRLKIADRTIIVFTSDNGGNMYNEIDGTTPTSNAPLRGGKATVFEGGTRVPCVVAWPGVTTGGATCDVAIQSEDYYPTLLAGLGLSPETGQSFDGMSFFPVLRGEPMAREALFQYFPHEPAVPDWLPPSVSIHQGDWKLIRIFHGGENGEHRYLLFNLKEDLSESQNLAAERRDKVQELDQLITEFLQKTNAVLPQPNPQFDPTTYRAELEGKPVPKAKPAAKGKSARKKA
jgi:arylsulfatase A-like enzyme